MGVFQHVKFLGGDGSSIENAIIISGAENEMEGVDAEYNYLASKLGRENADWRIVLQSAIINEEQSFDVLLVEEKDGSQQEYYFDITGFFGKD